MSRTRSFRRVLPDTPLVALFETALPVWQKRGYTIAPVTIDNAAILRAAETAGRPMRQMPLRGAAG